MEGATSSHCCGNFSSAASRPTSNTPPSYGTVSVIYVHGRFLIEQTKHVHIENVDAFSYSSSLAARVRRRCCTVGRFGGVGHAKKHLLGLHKPADHNACSLVATPSVLGPLKLITGHPVLLWLGCSVPSHANHVLGLLQQLAKGMTAS